ncbi:MAG: amidohydrolase [Actinobacteria bacterium]|nr:amidohydrolase [Actinomycetota bacterium]
MTLTVCTGGTVLVGTAPDGTPEFSTAIAFDGTGVVALGAEAEALGGRADELIDLSGGTLAPAPGDGHAHPVLGALEAAGPKIRAAEDLAGILAAVAEWKAANPDAEWIVGGSYDATFAPGGRFDARWLDEVTGDTPTVLRSWDYHTVWVNTAALEAAGITAATPDPELGRILRREDGSPLGTLQEAAANDLLANVAPAYTLAQRVDAVERATAEYASIGMTWVQDAWVEPADVAHYLAAAEQGRLHTRINLALRADPAAWQAQPEQFAGLRTQVRELSERLYGTAHGGASRLSADTVKFFVDGVIENHTAALSAPYADRPSDFGLPNWQVDELREAVAAFSAAGFQLHLHAIGDAAVTAALDALESAQAAEAAHAAQHGDAAPRAQHVIAHVAMLRTEDIERFARLGVIANFEPYWAQCDAVMRDLTIPHIGHDREGWQYLIGSVHRSGATISFGSDWPVTTKDWRPALATAITRHSHLEPQAEPWLPDERVSPQVAYAAYTTGIAAQAQVADRGSLRPGMVADAVWLSENPLTINPTDIASLQVHGTWLAGARTH